MCVRLFKGLCAIAREEDVVSRGGVASVCAECGSAGARESSPGHYKCSSG